MLPASSRRPGFRGLGASPALTTCNRLGAQAPGPPFPHLGSGCDDFGLKELEEVTNKMPADPAGVVSPKIHIYLEPQEVPLVWT